MYYNTKRKRTGHLFQGRYKSIIVDKENYFLELTKYIHLNPVKAGMVNLPEEYKWSSYNGYISKTDDRYIDREEIRAITDLWGKRYRDFVMASIDERIDPFKDIYGGILLGNSIFIKEKLEELKEQIEGKHISHKDELRGYVKKEEILEIIKREYSKGAEELKVRTRKSKARNIAIYLMRELTGLTNSEIGDIFDMKYSAVSKASLGLEKEMVKDKGLKKDVKRIISNFEA